jgi:hypothetical protein
MTDGVDVNPHDVVIAHSVKGPYRKDGKQPLELRGGEWSAPNVTGVDGVIYDG